MTTGQSSCLAIGTTLRRVMQIAMVIDLAHGFMHAIWATHVAMAMGHPKSEVALGNLPIC